MVVHPKQPKMIIFSRANPWLLGTTILGNPEARHCHPENSIPQGRLFRLFALAKRGGFFGGVPPKKNRKQKTSSLTLKIILVSK